MSKTKNTPPIFWYYVYFDPRIQKNPKKLKKVRKVTFKTAVLWKSKQTRHCHLVSHFNFFLLKSKVGFWPNLSSLKIWLMYLKPFQSYSKFHISKKHIKTGHFTLRNQIIGSSRRTGPPRKVVDGSLGPSRDPEAGSKGKKNWLRTENALLRNPSS